MTHDVETPADTPQILRMRAGLRQSELARRAKIAVRTLSDMENGRSVRFNLIQRVAAALGVATWIYVMAMELRASQRKCAALAASRKGFGPSRRRRKVAS